MTLTSNLLYLEEPLLEFKFGQKLTYPRDGLFLYGPVDDSKDTRLIRYGVVSTSSGYEHFKHWANQIKGLSLIHI